MKNKGKWLVSVASCLAFVCALALAGCSSGTTASTDNASNADSSTKETTQLQIFAANSLSKAMDEVQQLYTRDHVRRYAVQVIGRTKRAACRWRFS